MRKITISKSLQDGVKLGLSLLDWKGDDSSLMEKAEEFINLFNLNIKSPRGMKKQLDSLRFIKKQVDLHKEYGGSFGVQNLKNTLSWWKPKDIEEIVSAFLGSTKIVELREKNYLFVNESPLSDKSFKAIAKELTSLFGRFRGEYKKALTGEVVVRIKSEGVKAKALYKRDKDEVWIKYSPKVTSLMGKEVYGWLPYILVHELGHRYEEKVGRPRWYDSNRFKTTPYSYKEGVSGSEDFAECFALTFFGERVHPSYSDWSDQLEEFTSKFSGSR